ncbi:peptidase inhibitor family I36 protein [Saccharopolyspora sp. NPDC050389]|uniref:peptidase inhibitor family I36 protein n=1 Tax=Saccharopolyspora sp. NPDC050389 TaxID=3155516 RepID=UPI0033D4C955
MLSVLAAIAVGAGGAYAAPPETPCPTGSFCSWPEENFAGQSHEVGLQAHALEQCVQLQQGVETRSFVNNTGHPVTAYQDPDCDTEAEFSTYPTGSQNPRTAYVVRAIKIWSH